MAGGQSDVSIVGHWPAHATVVVGLGNLSDDFTNRPTVPSWHLTPASLSADRNIFLSPYLKEPQNSKLLVSEHMADHGDSFSICFVTCGHNLVIHFIQRIQLDRRFLAASV